ncbi:MAG: GIY-YIG nuclease family protein [Rhodanobacteraceae bacterium]
MLICNDQQAARRLHSCERSTRDFVHWLTGSLKLRIWEYREGLVSGFTKRYGVKQLVWYELHADFPSAIKRETQLKKWNRAWKLELMESANRDWRDLWDDLLEQQSQNGFPLARE